MKVELLYFDGCPSFEALLPRVREVLADLDAEAELELRKVETETAAIGERFLGSPTLRVDGRDIEPGAAARSDYGLKCRLYRVGDCLSSTPDEAWLQAALEAG
jgi:hypothetical protein